MKVIVQCLPNEDEILLNNINIGNYVLDLDIYAYFLRLFEKEFEEYIYKKYGKKLLYLLIEEQQGDISPEKALKIAREYWDLYSMKYIKPFNKQRQNFHLFNGKIYS